MENASKALIIAGAILLSILIIALGVFIFNMARSSIDTNALDSVTISTFNDPIVDYEGKTVGTSVQKLLSDLITNCATNSGSAEKLPDVYYYDVSAIGPVMSSVTGTGVTSTATTVEITSKVGQLNTAALTRLRTLISRTHYYYVGVEYNTQGLVACVHIGYSSGDETPAAPHTDTTWYGTAGTPTP